MSGSVLSDLLTKSCRESISKLRCDRVMTDGQMMILQDTELQDRGKLKECWVRGRHHYYMIPAPL